MRLFSPLGWLFAIRAEVPTATRLLLWTVFLTGVFGLWVFATDYPQWLKRGIIYVFPQHALREGDVIELRLDRTHRQLEIVKRDSGRAISRDLPPLAATALPEFSPAHYETLFHRLEDDGLGGFERVGQGAYSARIVDAVQARARLHDLGPLPYQRPVSTGESVDIEIDAATGQALFRLERVPVGGARAALETLPAEAVTRARPEHYPALGALAAAVGVTDLRPIRDPMPDVCSRGR